MFKSFEYGNELLLPHKKAAKHWVLTDLISLNLKSHISITCLKNGFIKCPNLFSLCCLHSIPLALWPFITIAHQRFRKGRKNLSCREANRETVHSLLGMSHLQLCATCSVLGQRWRTGEGAVTARPAAAWEGVPGRCSLGCLIFQNSSQTRCFTMGELLLRLQL